MFDNFFQGNSTFNLITFILGFLSLGLSIWLAINSYPKKLMLYYEGIKPLINQFYKELKSIELNSKTIILKPENRYLITTLYLQNTGKKDFTINDFENGIKIKFPKELTILEIINIDYPKEVNSLALINSQNEIEVSFNILKKREIIKFEILGELKESVHVFKEISFQCRGSNIAKGKIQKVVSKPSFDHLGEVLLLFLFSFLMFIMFCFSLGLIGEKPIIKFLNSAIALTQE